MNIGSMTPFENPWLIKWILPARIMMMMMMMIVVVVICVWTPSIHCQSDPVPNNFDDIFKEINIITRQQLEQLQTTTSATPTAKTTATTTTTVTKTNRAENDETSSGEKLKPSSSGKNIEHFRIPSEYDPAKPPKRAPHKPIIINVDMTVLDVTIDKLENLIVLDLKLKERWKDRRLRIRKSESNKIMNVEASNIDNGGGDDGDDYDYEIENVKKQKKLERSHLLDGSYLPRIWHPVSRLQNNVHVTNALFEKPKQSLQKTVEQEKLVEYIFIMANASTAQVWITLKMRVNIPIYECKRDDSRLYPFDKIYCSFHIANVLHDQRTLNYQWDQVKWDHNEYHNGQFYLSRLSTSIDSEPIIDIDESGNEHSVMKIDFMLKRQIGDYVLNIYILHIFLYLLILSTFWMKKNFIIRLSFAIIILIIIKFQTFQTLKDQHRIGVSALSIWAFGLSCLVVLCILCHILSYYSHQHKWNEKILDRLVSKHRHSNNANKNYDDHSNHSTRKTDTANFNDNSIEDGGQSDDGGSSTNGSTNNTLGSGAGKFKIFKTKYNKWKRNLLIRLNSIIVNNTQNQSYENTNLVDIISRIVLIILFLMFVSIYFIKYAL